MGSVLIGGTTSLLAVGRSDGKDNINELRAKIEVLRSTIDELDVVELFVKMVGEEQANGDIVVPGDALQIVSSTLSIFSKARELLAAIEMYSVDKKMAYLIYNRAIFLEHEVTGKKDPGGKTEKKS